MSRSGSGKGGKKGKRYTDGFRNKTSGNRGTKKNLNASSSTTSDLIRLNRYVANSGVCSRRDADIFIASGNVTVNGKPVTEMGYKVKLSDEVKFDGQLLSPEKKLYVVLNKPRDFATSGRDAKGHRTAMTLISKASKKPLLPVGKMNKASMGLLVFTNDGDLIKRLNSPKNGLRKIYHLELSKPLRSADLKQIQEGVTVDDKLVRVQDICFVDDAPKTEVGIEIHSCRNAIVRRLFEVLGYEIVKLDRVVYAGLTKKDLPRGHWRYLTDQEVINLKIIA